MTTEQTRRLDRGFPGGYDAGTIATWINVSRTTPIPADWLERSTLYTGPVPAGAPILDAAEAAAASQHTPSVQPPDRILTSEQLQRKIPALRHADNYDVARSLGFPAPRNPYAGADSWSERAVDRWLADLKSKQAQIALFVGDKA